MSPLSSLRQTRHFMRQTTRLMLVWFVLSIGAAVASPMVNPRAVELVCSASGGMKVLIKTDDGNREEAGTGVGHTLDCPMCASLAAPPPAITTTAEPYQPLSYALRSVPAAVLAARTAAPPPGRGPPAHS
jgi:hypothetical protein